MTVSAWIVVHRDILQMAPSVTTAMAVVSRAQGLEINNVLSALMIQSNAVLWDRQEHAFRHQKTCLVCVPIYVSTHRPTLMGPVLSIEIHQNISIKISALIAIPNVK